MHDQDIIYRDLKPENILVGNSGHLKLADFGLSKSNVGNTYASTSFVGTPAYLSPDILRKNPYGKTLDWYGLGVILYEFLHS